MHDKIINQNSQHILHTEGERERAHIRNSLSLSIHVHATVAVAAAKHNAVCVLNEFDGVMMRCETTISELRA